MITLFGATGYTGQLIADALAREALPFRLAGRSADKLAALSARLPGNPPWLVADAEKPGTLPPLFVDTRMLVNVAGPFTDLGEPVIARAAMSGVNYMDTTNELGFVFRARGYHSMAARTGAALVPAAGFEVAFADCAAALVAARLGPLSAENPLDQIHIVYALGGKGTSAGTRRSAVRSLATSWVAYRDGDWVGQIPGGRVKSFNLPAGKRHALSFPSSESVTVPAHLPVVRVDSWMTTTPGARFWAPFAIPLFARLSRSVLRPLLLMAADSGGVSASSSQDNTARKDAPYTIFVCAQRGTTARWIALTGADPYLTTAQIAAYFARQLSQPDYQLSGMLAPAQAVDPQAFLDYAVSHWGVRIQEGDTVA